MYSCLSEIVVSEFKDIKGKFTWSFANATKDKCPTLTFFGNPLASELPQKLRTDTAAVLVVSTAYQPDSSQRHKSLLSSRLSHRKQPNAGDTGCIRQLQ